MIRNTIWSRVKKMFSASPPAKPARSANRFRLSLNTLEGREVPAGLLDTTFSSDGKLTTAFDLGSPPNDQATAVAIDSSGRTVVAGLVKRTATGDFDFGVTRYTTTGALDTSFSGDGKTVIAFDLGGNKDDRPTGIAIDSFGRIIVVGSVQRNLTGDFDFGVARLTTTGALDTSFAGTGKTAIAFDIGGSRNDQATGVAIDSFNRIIVGGYTQRNFTGDYDFAVTRLLPSGGRDGSFSVDGRATAAFDLGGAKDDRATGVAIDRLGRIVLGGYTQRNSTGDYDFAAARFNTFGNLDTSFSSDGKAVVAFNLGGSRDDRANGVAVDSFNRVVLGGYTQRVSSGDYDFAAARLTATGVLDTSFAGSGKTAIAFDLGGAGRNNDRANSIVIDNVGNILLGGFALRSTGSDFDFAVTRLNTFGGRDANFSGDGKVTVAFNIPNGGKSDAIRAIAVDSRRRVTAVGSVQFNNTGDFDFGVIRLSGDF